MFGTIEASPQIGSVEIIDTQSSKMAGVIENLSAIFNGHGLNPGTEISGSSESGFSIQGGGTFVASNEVHTGLAEALDKIYSGSSDEITGGHNGSREVAVLKKINSAVSKAKDEYNNMSTVIQTKVQNLDSLKNMLNQLFNRLYELALSDPRNNINAQNIQSVQQKIMLEFDRQLGILQSVLKVSIKPTQNNFVELLKKNSDFTILAETLGVTYGDETASDRLALVFTNLTDVSILSDKVKQALKELNISLSDYKNIKNSKELSDALYSVFKNFNKKNLKSQDLTTILEAMSVLKTSQGSHDEIVKVLSGGKRKKSDSPSSSSSSSSDENVGGRYEGGAYDKEIGRQSKNRLKSNLSNRVTIYEKTMKELYKNFMNQINNKFKSLVVLIDMLSNKVGSEIVYDDDLKDFIKMFLGFNENISNEKIFYSLINLDNTVAGKELRNRFVDTLGKIIDASKKLNNYPVFKNITSELSLLQNDIDTMSDTVINLKKAEEEKTGSSDFMWTNKLVDQSFSMNNIKLMKESIKRLSFYAKVATIKENLHRMNKEQKFYQEDYDKLLGKSIGLKLTELQREYVENVDRLNDKTRGRGRLLEEYNSKNPTKQLPRGLVETIYKLQYEAKEGLYKSLEAIDLYLMHFTEQLSAHPEAVMDLHKMLEQTDIIAKWFTQKSVDNMFELLSTQITSKTNSDDQIKTISETLNIPTLLQNDNIPSEKIKTAFEQTKKCIDSIAVLKNIISMFIHLGEKYGNVNLTEKLNISPNMIYKHLVKYIWVSAFTMGYGTGGGNKTTPNDDTLSKGVYERETGDFDSFFSVLFTTLVMPLDFYKEIELSDIMPALDNINDNNKETAKQLKERLRQDIFIIDDRYFILGLKAMIGKIFTVVDTHTLLHTPDTLANIMRNPVRMIIGASDVEVNPELIELYIRLPLLVEFYKSIFENGNLQYKENNQSNSEIEVIAYIPEIGTVWSGLIQCIFDESKYINNGIYSLNNMKDIVNEVNKIYKSYKSTSKDKLVRTIVLDFVAEINRRYGILKQKDIAEFYQIKKKYIKNVTDMPLEDNVNFDILDENNEYEYSGPSSQYVESSFNKYSSDSLIFNDIKLVHEFRNKIYNELFGNEQLVGELSAESFNESIKNYKQQIIAAESAEVKFELIAKAIDQSSNINSYNIDVYLLYHELVQSPLYILTNIENKTKRLIIDFLTKYSEKTSNSSKLAFLTDLYKDFNDGSLFKVKQISNNRFVVDYSHLQSQVEVYIENIKYMISKFRNSICTQLINKDEQKLYNIENSLLNNVIKGDSSVENYVEFYSLDHLNKINTLFLLYDLPINGKELFAHIMFEFPMKTDANGKEVRDIGILTAKPIDSTSHQLLQDIDLTYEPNSKSWNSKKSWYRNYIFDHTKAIKDNTSFKNKSILQKFNMLVFSYLEQFYNPSTKKIYSKLIDEFANKAMSASIFEEGGIPDLFADNSQTFPYQSGQEEKIEFGVPNNSSVLSMTTVMTLRALLTRTLNIQLPIKYHLIDIISEVSTIQIEKYKAYLPSFITYFEHLIKECLVYKNILDNPEFEFIYSPTSTSAISVELENKDLTDDFKNKLTFTTKLVKNDLNDFSAPEKYGTILNNIINGSRALINDATNVLNELNDIPQFGNIRDNFIKNFYNNNHQLPYSPLSLLNLVSDQMSSQNCNLLPIHLINTNENKYIYGTNVILNYNKSEDINNYLWLKEQVKVYNNGVLSTNNIEIKKLNQSLNITKDLVKSEYFRSHVNYNLYWRSTKPYTIPSEANINTEITKLKGTSDNTANGKKLLSKLEKMLEKIKIHNTIIESLNKEKNVLQATSKATLDAIKPNDMVPKEIRAFLNAVSSKLSAFLNPVSSKLTDILEATGEGEIRGGSNFIVESYNKLEIIINLIENQLNDNKKYNIVSQISGNSCQKNNLSTKGYNLDRSKARILNIIDLNINPINIHALMREVPLVNVYNYAFTFDNVIKSFIYNVNPDINPAELTDSNPEKKVLFKLSCYLQDPYYINYRTDTNSKARDLLENALNYEFKPTTPSSNPTNLYFATPKYTHNIFEKLNDKYKTKNDDDSKGNDKTGTLYHNNKFLRNILFLVNAQRVIRLKIKNAVYRINTNVVSDTNILNMRITDYSDYSDKKPNDNEFEIPDLF